MYDPALESDPITDDIRRRLGDAPPLSQSQIATLASLLRPAGEVAR